MGMGSVNFKKIRCGWRVNTLQKGLACIVDKFLGVGRVLGVLTVAGFLSQQILEKRK